MTIRWKLALTLALPLVALAFVVGRGVLEERRTMAENEDARELIQLALLGRDVMGRAQLEHGLELAGGYPGAIRDLRERRREAVQAFQEALASDARERFGFGFQQTVMEVEQAIRAFEAAEQSSGDTGAAETVARLGQSVVDLTYEGARSIDHDGELAQRLLGYAALLEAEQKLGELFGGVAALPDGASLSGALRLRLARDRGELDTALSAFAATAASDDRAALEQAVPTGALGALTTAATLDRDAFTEAASRGVEAVDALSASVAGELDALAASKQDEASRDALEFLALGGSATVVGLVALLLALRFSARLVRRLRRLSNAAEELSEQRLPALVEGLRSGRTSVAAEEAPFQLGELGRDEIGALGRSFETVHGTVLEVAREQARILEQGISDIFVKLARRNQALIERQIALLDQLERDEEDPDVLADLFRIDHIATRIRRNAESLLVLAGSESARKWNRPLPLADVVQAATAEIEDYERIRLAQIDDAQIRAHAAVDLAHLLAELLENAVRFSPPDSVVEVACRTRGGSCQVVIADRGIGLTEEQLDEANELLSNPPVAGLDLSRTLGHYVVARLARRHGIEVRLAPGAMDGLVALVSLPVGLLHEEEPERPAIPVNGGAPATEPADGSNGHGALPQRPLPRWDDVQAATESLPAAFGPSAAALPAAPDPPAVAPEPEPQRPPATFEPLPARLRPPDPAPPADGHPTSDLPRRGATVIFTVPPGPGAGVATSRRSPQERRDLISRFRRGFASGRQRSDGPSTDGEERRDG
jgi:HAMP domain-containing protein/two-component sensor histidine kinase